MNDITIPPEVISTLRGLISCGCDKCLSKAIRAALKAWPGAAERRSWDGSIGRLILPLTEPDNAEA